MLDGIDDVDWARLEDAYGPTPEMPARLRTLAAGEDGWQEALDALYAGIVHQGSYYPATAPATRFLCRMAVDPTVPTRAEILLLVAELSGAHRGDVAEGWDPFTFRSRPAPPEYAEAAATIEEIERVAASFVPSLADVDDRVRMAAAHLLGGLVADPPGQRAALLQALVDTDDPVVAASFIVAAMRLSSPGDPTSWLDDVASRFDAPIVHGAVAVARAAAGAPDLAALERAALFDPGDEPACLVEQRLAALAVTAMGRVEGATPGLRRVTEAWLARLGPLFDFHARDEWADEPQGPTPAQWRNEELVRSCAAMVVDAVFAPYVDRVEPLLPEELDADQRAVLRWTIDFGVALPVRALPWIRGRDMARFVADDGLGLDHRVAGVPLWKTLHAVTELEAERRDDPTVADVAFADALSMLGGLAAATLFDACRDLLDHAYPHPGGWSYCLRSPRHAHVLALVEPHRAALVDRFAALREELCARESVEPALARFALSDLDLGGDLDPSLDPLLPSVLADPDVGRRALAPMSTSRRSRIVGRTRPKLRDPLLDLCDVGKVAEAALDAFLDEAWRMSWFVTFEDLRGLGQALVAPARARLARATGRKQALLFKLLDELEGRVTDAVLEVVADDVVLRATLRDDGHARRWRLPPVPEREHLAPIAAAFAEPRMVRLRLQCEASIEQTITYRLQRLLAELGFRSVSSGGSTVSVG